MRYMQEWNRLSVMSSGTLSYQRCRAFRFFSVKYPLYLIFVTYKGRILYRSTLRNWQWNKTQTNIIYMDFVLIYLTGLKKLSGGISFALAQISLWVSALNITAAITKSTLFLMRRSLSFPQQWNPQVSSKYFTHGGPYSRHKHTDVDN